MKTVILGDTHGRSIWKLIVNIEKPERIIFLGDYFDSWDFTGLEQMNNVENIIRHKVENIDSLEVVLLIGNHDHHYFPEIGDSGTSGYQIGGMPVAIGALLNEHRDHFQMAYQFDNILCTHAGVTRTWLEQVGWAGEPIVEYINDVWKHRPKSFSFESYGTRAEPSGSNIWQSPIWVRPRSLLQDGIDKKEFIQVVGHSTVRQIDPGKATGGRYYFIDCLGTSQEYLVVQDGEIQIKSCKSQYNQKNQRV